MTLLKDTAEQIAQSDYLLDRVIASLTVKALARYQSTCLTETARRSIGQRIHRIRTTYFLPSTGVSK